MAELLLYSARETQLLEEVTRPALAEYEVVIADRFLYTAEVLARWGRGLPEHVVRPVVDACTRGLRPERVFLIDVDPAIARARRRISKLLAPDTGAPSSRKGLAGAGMQTRLRAGYRALAAESPEQWTLIENTDVTLEALVTQLTQEVLRMVRGGEPGTPCSSPGVTTPPRSADEARARFLERVDRWMEEEPGLAARFLSGLEGADIDERRERLAARCPELIAHGLAGLTDTSAWDLRARLEQAAPMQVLGSLKALAAESSQAWALRERWEQRAPEAVAASLDGLGSQQAWAMRERLHGRFPSPWSPRSRGSVTRGPGCCASAGCPSGEVRWRSARRRWRASPAGPSGAWMTHPPGIGGNGHGRWRQMPCCAPWRDSTASGRGPCANSTRGGPRGSSSSPCGG
ncbi:dTMP kinase [Cystobacter fuscus]